MTIHDPDVPLYRAEITTPAVTAEFTISSQDKTTYAKHTAQDMSMPSDKLKKYE